MPLNRDQQNPRMQSQPSTDQFKSSSLSAAVQERRTNPLDIRSSSRNQNKDRNSRQMLDHNDLEQNVNLERSGRNLESLKIPIPGSFRKNGQAPSLPSSIGQRSWQSKKSRHVSTSAFDDTESFNHSELDQDDTEEVTAVLRSDSTLQHRQQGSAGTVTVSTASGLQTSKSITQHVPSQQWPQVDLDRLQYDKEFEGHVESSRPDAAAFHEDLDVQDDDEFDVEMDTPSRPQALSRTHVTHGTKKKVDFVNDAEIFGGSIRSPFTRSAELARELSPDLQTTQASRIKDFGAIVSENAVMQHEKNQHNHTVNASTRSGPASSRFTKLHEHKLHVLEQTNKVSAPDSDVQESSDDDRIRVTSTDKRNMDVSVLAVRKRGYDWNSASEYTMEEMRGKQLSDLQNEPFLKSPNVQAKHLVSDNDHETLPAKLQKLQEYTEDEQRAIFRAQNDDEWTQIGKWFVEKLAEDLEKLIAVRLERRKIALRYEDQLRRRQKEIEWVQGGVENELKELESGGGELIRNRKTPSRAGTPMKLS